MKRFGPKCKQSRREGVDLFLKSGVRPLENKCNFNTRPGQHGARRGRETDYGVQLRAKQVIRSYYRMLENPFKRAYAKASRMTGATGLNLLNLLESRLDNVVYRLGLASTRAEARQLVSHRSIEVNGKCVSIPSYSLSDGDIVTVKEKAQKQERIQFAKELSKQRTEDPWLQSNEAGFGGTFKRLPEMDELPTELVERIQLVVELYSK